MKYAWKDLEKPMNCFTVRNAAMKNLDTGKNVQYYSANTKIMVTQKCVTSNGAYYRTDSARAHSLNYAFEASAFGLPNEHAPSAHPNISQNNNPVPEIRTLLPAKKQKLVQEVASPKDGGARRPKGWLAKLLRRKNG